MPWWCWIVAIVGLSSPWWLFKLFIYFGDYGLKDNEVMEERERFRSET